MQFCKRCGDSRKVTVRDGAGVFIVPCPDCATSEKFIPLTSPDFWEEINRALGCLSLLRFFPKDDVMIRVLLADICGTPEQAQWIGQAALLAWNDWPGPRDLRALFCQRFRPKDGIEVSLERPIARHFNSEDVKRLRQLPYAEYLESDHWKILRGEKLRDAGYRCQLCNSVGGLHVHHRTYDNRGREPLSDLIVLCNDCHGLFHDKLQD